MEGWALLPVLSGTSYKISNRKPDSICFCYNAKNATKSIFFTGSSRLNLVTSFNSGCGIETGVQLRDVRFTLCLDLKGPFTNVFFALCFQTFSRIPVLQTQALSFLHRKSQKIRNLNAVKKMYIYIYIMQINKFIKQMIQKNFL